jgi:hypothetical protein
MSCVAAEYQYYEDELNGCVGDPCPDDSGPTCDGELLTECHRGQLHTRDCRKHGGPSSTCVIDEKGRGRCTRPSCDPPNREHCEGDLAVVCEEDGQLFWLDCTRCDPEGVCIADPTSTDVGGQYCNRPRFGCPASAPTSGP